MLLSGVDISTSGITFGVFDELRSEIKSQAEELLPWLKRSFLEKEEMKKKKK